MGELRVEQRKLSWPSKVAQQEYEIQMFIAHYHLLPHGRKFAVVAKRDRPDYVVCDVNSGQEFGIELASAHPGDLSVPKPHGHLGSFGIQYFPDAILKYEEQIAAAVREKVEKARGAYPTECPLILSIYTNGYATLSTEDWRAFVQRYEAIFNDLSPFAEVVFWPLLSGKVLSVRPCM